MIRKISAHFIYLNSKALLKFGVIAFSPDGVITDIRDNNGMPEESEGLEFSNGIITPGFIDIDCSCIQSRSAQTYTPGPKGSFQVELPERGQFLILENPERLAQTEVLRLFSLEREGVYIILKFDNNPMNLQQTIFKNICKLILPGTIDFADILRWTTINPALYMGIDHSYGTIAPGKQPGLNAISGFDYSTMHVTETSSIRVIV